MGVGYVSSHLVFSSTTVSTWHLPWWMVHQIVQWHPSQLEPSVCSLHLLFLNWADVVRPIKLKANIDITFYYGWLKICNYNRFYGAFFFFLLDIMFDMINSLSYTVHPTDLSEVYQTYLERWFYSPSMSGCLDLAFPIQQFILPPTFSPLGSVCGSDAG